MKILGIVLILAGIGGFVFGGFKVKQEKNVADLGPVQINKEETHSFPVTPLASGALLVAGIALLVVGARKK